MNNLSTFFQIPLVRLAIHVIIIAGFVLNIYQFYRVWEVQVATNQSRTILETWSDLDTQEAYLQSPLYKEKFSKDKNYSKRGEEVIDTSAVEDGTKPQPNEFIYASSSAVGQKSNVEKWWECFFGKNRDECVKR